MRGGWGGYPRGGGGGPVVARAPAPREWRRGPWRQLAWGAVRERVCECVRAAGVARRAGPGGPCLPACRRPPSPGGSRGARAHSRPTDPHTPDGHTHARRQASRRSGRVQTRAAAHWGRGGGAGGCKTAGRGGKKGRGGQAALGGGLEERRGVVPLGGGVLGPPVFPYPVERVGHSYLSARRGMSDSLASPLCYVIPTWCNSISQVLLLCI